MPIKNRIQSLEREILCVVCHFKADLILWFRFRDPRFISNSWIILGIPKSQVEMELSPWTFFHELKSVYMQSPEARGEKR